MNGLKRIVLFGVLLMAGLSFADMDKDQKDVVGLYQAGNFAEAQQGYAKLIADYPAAPQNRVASWNAYIGFCLAAQSKNAEALVYLKKALDTKTADKRYDVLWGVVCNKLYWIYSAQGKYAEANAAMANSIVYSAAVEKVTGKYLLECFGRLNPAIMSADDYKTLLQDIIKTTPATEERAEFLGRIKSEIEKMK
jgi:tetratricopeptide (TPR) repeat protein